MITKSPGPSWSRLLYMQRFKWSYIPDYLCYETNSLRLSLTSKGRVDPTKKPEWLVLEKKLYVTLQDRVSRTIWISLLFFSVIFSFVPLKEVVEAEFPNNIVALRVSWTATDTNRTNSLLMWSLVQQTQHWTTFFGQNSLTSSFLDSLLWLTHCDLFFFYTSNKPHR